MTKFISITTLHYLKNGFLNGGEGMGNIKLHKVDGFKRPTVSPQCFRKNIKEMLREQGVSISYVNSKHATQYSLDNWDYKFFGGMNVTKETEETTETDNSSKKSKDSAYKALPVRNSFISTTGLCALNDGILYSDFGVKFASDNSDNAIYNTEYINDTYFTHTSVIKLKTDNIIGEVDEFKKGVLLYLNCLRDYTSTVKRTSVCDMSPIGVVATLSGSANPLTENFFTYSDKINTRIIADDRVQNVVSGSKDGCFSLDTENNIDKAFSVIREWVELYSEQ